MALINWNDQEYSVGVIKMDEQHKKLIGMINDLHEAMRAGKGTEGLFAIIKEMNAYTAVHFSEEETMLKNNGYPAFEKQVEEHEQFITEVKSIEADVASGKLFLSMNTMDFLKKWWSSHILVQDKKYTEFLNSKGIN